MEISAIDLSHFETIAAISQWTYATVTLEICRWI
jgi:hypothetical protein